MCIVYINSITIQHKCSIFKGQRAFSVTLSSVYLVFNKSFWGFHVNSGAISGGGERPNSLDSLWNLWYWALSKIFLNVAAFVYLEYTIPPLLATPSSASCSLSPGARTGKPSSCASRCLTVSSTLSSLPGNPGPQTLGSSARKQWERPPTSPSVAPQARTPGPQVPPVMTPQRTLSWLIIN